MNQRNSKIIEFFLRNQSGGSADVLAYLTSHSIEASSVTVKRDLSKLTADKSLEKHGKGPETAYSLTTVGRIGTEIDAHEYCATEPDKRFGNSSFNFSLLKEVPTSLFSAEEKETLLEATTVFKTKTGTISPAASQKELERFVIELSWKSSRIEGNTYNLLDTEKLIRQGIEAPGHDRDEAVMILNHKKAFDFVCEYRELFMELDRAGIEKVHELLVGELGIERGYRQGLVGIVGSKYRPLDNGRQIKEAMDDLFTAVSRMQDPYSKALLALLGLSYIQPFEDGNKRTSRLIANAILLAYGVSPLSYRSVDEGSYREAMLVFYELNSARPFKDIFISQYAFAAENYAI